MSGLASSEDPIVALGGRIPKRVYACWCLGRSLVDVFEPMAVANKTSTFGLSVKLCTVLCTTWYLAPVKRNSVAKINNVILSKYAALHNFYGGRSTEQKASEENVGRRPLPDR